MNNQVKIVVADDNQSFCKLLQKFLQAQEDFQIVGIAYNGLEAWELIKSQEPDLVILDQIMPNLDGLGILERINNHTTMKRPKIIMQTAFGQEFLTHEAILHGVDYFILKPFDLEVLRNRICSLTQEMSSVTATQIPKTSPAAMTQNRDVNLNVDVTKVMHQIGIPAHVKGYHYIREAIQMVVEDVSLLGAVTKELYPLIAKKFNSAPNRVERGIRHAIGLAWDRGQKETLKRIFGYSINIELQKPTNSEFIALLADNFRVMSKVS
ncbi:sporulation transcription factor Spo0A [Desulfosporosinus sp. SB140]|uniref:sporulation transcription factor Spo0A n=1 Tax=Desulfosporosinus paludis TaxID=3115649 RepID=UPI00388D71DD